MGQNTQKSGNTGKDEGVKVLWDINVQCGNLMETRRPDIIVADKKENQYCCTS